MMVQHHDHRSGMIIEARLQPIQLALGQLPAVGVVIALDDTVQQDHTVVLCIDNGVDAARLRALVFAENRQKRLAVIVIADCDVARHLQLG